MFNLKKNKGEKGITLIALIVTIVVLLILAGVSIAMLTGNSGILTQSNRAKISTELSSYKEELDLFKIEQISKDDSFLEESLTAGKNNLFYNTQEDGETGTIKNVITNISDDYLEKIEIIKGELLINTKDNNEIKVAKSLGIEVNPYDIDENGVLQSTGNNLALMDENGTLVIPDSVTEIGRGAFANEGLKTIIIPGTVKKIGVNAFAYNTTLETVIMQEGVEEIGENAFAGCDNLKNITLAQSLKKIGGMAFYSCDNLQEIEIPGNVEVLSYNVFDDCIKLSKVTLNEGLKTIATLAFADTIFQEISIPSTVTIIEQNIFVGNDKLENINLNGNINFVYEKGMLLNKDKTSILFLSYAHFKNENTLEIPEGMKSFNVGIQSFTNINKIIIPSSLIGFSVESLPITIKDIEVKEGNGRYEYLDDNKILYDKNIKKIVICCSEEETIDLYNIENIDIIGEYSFKFAEKAKEIILPKSTKSIEDMAFYRNYNLQKLSIGENVNDIDPLFKYRNYSGEVEISSQNQNFVIEDKVLYNKEKSKLICVLKNIEGNFKVKDSVTEIGSKAFHYQRGLTSIELPEKLTIIEDSFIATGITEIVIPKSVNNISSNCFGLCSNLNKVTIYNEKLLETAPWGATKGDKVINLQK